MVLRDACTNCGKFRDSPSAPCIKCLYPHHKNQLDNDTGLMQQKHPIFHFHLRTLVALTTIAAIACAIMKIWGPEGLWFGFRIVAPLIPAICYYWMNFRSKKPNAIEE